MKVFNRFSGPLIILVIGSMVPAACKKADQTQGPTRLLPLEHDAENLPMTTDTIQLALTAGPSPLSMSARAEFTIELAATNRGRKTIDPHLNSVQLFVNGKASTAWNLAIGNGHRDDKWFDLPPGETISMRWSSLGKSLFPEPGDYSLVLHHGDQQKDPVEIRVLP